MQIFITDVYVFFRRMYATPTRYYTAMEYQMRESLSCNTTTLLIVKSNCVILFIVHYIIRSFFEEFYCFKE